MEDTGKFNWDKEMLFQGETLCADQLDRAKYAEFLTNYLTSAGQRDNGYVINLNAEWGAGKTWFLKRWYRELEENHPVAYIDAWKNDFSDTPMLTVVSGILSSLEADPNTKVLKNRHRFAESFKTISKRALPTLATGLAKQYLGVDLNDDGKTDPDAAEGLGRMFEKALEAHDQTLKGVEQYRTEITRWLEEATAENGTSAWKSPMYVFIDELDRCRPTYAIELLETVKHLFEIKAMVFVIATNTDQLQHSIKAVYGTGFDANRYLYRFFTRSFTLEQPKLFDFINSSEPSDQLWKVLETTFDGNLYFEKKECMVQLFAMIAEFQAFDLRTTLQWLERCLAALTASSQITDRYLWPYLLLMTAVKLDNPDLFSTLYVKRKSTTSGNKSIAFNRETRAAFSSYFDRLDARNFSKTYSGWYCSTEGIELEGNSDVQVPGMGKVSITVNSNLMFEASLVFLVDADQGYRPATKPSIKNSGEYIPISLRQFWDQKVDEKELDVRRYIRLIEMASDLD